jgi:hypothetical protein
MVEMTLEEAEWIARNRLPEEPPEDGVAAWRASRPRQEPRRQTRGLDTAPPPDPVDWAFVIRQAIKASRAEQAEVIGSALGEYGNQLADDLIAEIRPMIEEAIEGLRGEFTRQIDALRSDFTSQATELFESVAVVSTEGQRLKAELDKIAARRKRARAAKQNGSEGSPLMLPPPLADASLAPGNGDGREH